MAPEDDAEAPAEGASALTPSTLAGARHCDGSGITEEESPRHHALLLMVLVSVERTALASALVEVPYAEKRGNCASARALMVRTTLTAPLLACSERRAPTAAVTQLPHANPNSSFTCDTSASSTGEVKALALAPENVSTRERVAESGSGVAVDEREGGGGAEGVVEGVRDRDAVVVGVGVAVGGREGEGGAEGVVEGVRDRDAVVLAEGHVATLAAVPAGHAEGHPHAVGVAALAGQ